MYLPGRENRRDVLGGLGAGESWNRRDHVGGGYWERHWNWGTIQGHCRNLVSNTIETPRNL